MADIHVDKFGDVVSRNKRRYISKVADDPLAVMNNLFKRANRRNQKIGSVYFDWVKYMQHTDKDITLELLLVLSEKCGYKKGWAEIKFKELNVK